jgi:hypothetical protein
VVERLYILKGVWQLHWEGNIENNPARWLELLRPFTAVKGLKNLLEKSDGSATRPEHTFF